MAESADVPPQLEIELTRLFAERGNMAVLKRLTEAGYSLYEAKTWLATFHDRRAPPKKPCPYCCEPLRSDDARQCLACGMDWHDPNHVVRRGASA